MCAQNNDSKDSSRRWRVRWGRIVLLVGGAILFYDVLYFLFRGPLPPDPQLIAHRGGPEDNPGNTMAAFRYAIEMGADWLEMDVQRIQDGVLVVIHDEAVERTTDDTGNVRDMTFEQIRALDAGDGGRVSTFEEVLLLAQNRWKMTSVSFAASKCHWLARPAPWQTEFRVSRLRTWGVLTCLSSSCTGS